MNDKWLEFAIKIQSIAQTGLAYCKDLYDKERYNNLLEISAEMLSLKTEISYKKIKDLFFDESGYPTPKIDTRSAIFKDDKILLVKENNGTWSLPGGWCDVDQSVCSNAVKEVKEETGLDTVVDRLIAVQDWRKHNVCNYVYGVIKIFLLHKFIKGSFVENIETVGFKYFAKNEIPQNLAVEKTTKEQILTCFNAYENENQKVLID